MIQFDSFKRKIEYRSYAIQNSWRQQSTAEGITGQKKAYAADDYERRKELLEENIREAAAAKDLYEYEQQIYSNRRIIGRLIVFAKKAVRKLLVWTLGWYFIPLLRHQSFVNAKLINAVSLEREIRHKAVDPLQNTANSLQETVNSLQGTVDSLQSSLRALQDTANKLRGELTEHDRQIATLSFENDRMNARIDRIENAPSDSDDFYHAFEERFRGSREEIIARLGGYIPIVKEHISDFENSQFVDLGSGRGEWLDILRANGARNSVGVDLNDIQNDISRQLGHNVVCGDCIEYLSALEDGSVDMISGFQIIEHLYISDIIRLLEESKRVLKNGGVILFETTNPHNIIVGANTFYIDPSHRRPLSPELMEFIAQWLGFADVQIIPANAHEGSRILECDTDNEYLVELTRQFNDIKWILFGPQDYALFAAKG